MNLFGMGPWEMMIIVVAALVIFGPGKLPEVAGQAGRAVRDFRRMTSELSGEFEKTMADVTEGSLGSELKGITSQVNSVTKSVQKDLNKVGGSVAGKSPKSTTAKAATGAKSTTTTAATRSAGTSGAAKSTGTATKATPVPAPPAPKVASKADPLADLFFTEDDVPPASSANRGAAASSRPASAVSPARSAATPASAADTTDAVVRARQRRLAAGYNSHRSP